MPREGREWATKGDFDAECDTCGWRCTAKNAVGVGVQHARRHGHYVHIRIERSIVCDYTGKTKP